jgi:hypothetical protein
MVIPKEVSRTKVFSGFVVIHIIIALTKGSPPGPVAQVFGVDSATDYRLRVRGWNKFKAPSHCLQVSSPGACDE